MAKKSKAEQKAEKAAKRAKNKAQRAEKRKKDTAPKTVGGVTSVRGYSVAAYTRKKRGS